MKKTFSEEVALIYFKANVWPHLRIIRPNHHKRNSGHFMIGTNLPKGNENGLALANYKLKNL